MNDIHSIQFLGALAEITSHESREYIEQSLIETLQAYHNSKSYWLYQVLTNKPDLTLGLLSYTTKKKIISEREAIPQKLPDFLNDAVHDSVANGQVAVAENPKDSQDTYWIYPAADSHQNIFAILIERAETDRHRNQQLVHHVFRVYSNYLRLLEKSRRDKLTNLLNRETLSDEITRVLIQNREEIPTGLKLNPEHKNNLRQHKGDLRYWLGVLDIDHFKTINDTYGHVYGDDILILVAQLISQCVRSYDLVFRFGGEEFVILLKATSVNDARVTFERIRHEIGNHQFAKVKHVSVSIGFTEVDQQAAPSGVIDEADSALYYAKKNGRDQTHFYSELLANGFISSTQPTEEDSDISFFDDLNTKGLCN